MINSKSCYKEALQQFICFLMHTEADSHALEVSGESSEKELEEFILTQKDIQTHKDFYYAAGRTSQLILGLIKRELNLDEFNSCLNSLRQFEQFVGLRAHKV